MGKIMIPFDIEVFAMEMDTSIKDIAKKTGNTYNAVAIMKRRGTVKGDFIIKLKDRFKGCGEAIEKAKQTAAAG